MSDHGPGTRRDLRDDLRITIGRAMALYVLASSSVSLGLYLTLGLRDRLFTDWVIQIVFFGVLIAALCWPLIRRQPRNGAVWALLWVAVLTSTQALATGLLQRDLAVLGVSADLAHVVPEELPLLTAVYHQTASWGWVAGNFVFVLALMLFPDGCLPSRRWRTAAYGVLLGGVFATVTVAWTGRPSSSVTPMSDDLLGVLSPGGQVAMSAAMTVMLVAILTAFAALVSRYRASTGQVRAQLRWIAWATGLVVVEGIVLFPLMYVSPDNSLYRYTSMITFAVFLGAYVVAISRYRLYEIDRLISRTVSYTIVTAGLAGVYAGAVLVAQVVIGPSEGERPAIVVAGSTLLVAVLFGPMRHRAQQVVDRRFNRRTRDAADVVTAFGERLRDGIGLEVLVDELRSASSSVARPATVGVWLPDPSEGNGTTPPPAEGVSGRRW